MSSCNGFPTLMDDITMSKDLKSRIVDAYNGVGERDINNAYKIHSGLLISSNQQVDSAIER